MLNAGILPGDLVVVRQQQTCNPGEIVVAMIDDEATVKRFSRKNGHVWLMPENDAYAPIDGTYAQILGKVVGGGAPVLTHPRPERYRTPACGRMPFSSSNSSTVTNQ